MSAKFFDKPILNSPYDPPTRHWELVDGIPTDCIVERRRSAEYVTAVPPARRRDSAQSAMALGVKEPSEEGQEYDPTYIINYVRGQVETWRSIPNPNQWGVTPETARLLQHWRSYDFQGVRPFFCQVEAAETVIWLTEVAGLLSERAPTKEIQPVYTHVRGANAASNPELLRVALKMATGAGKTTVMAMLIAWQTINAVRYPRRRDFTNGFLIVTPGITIRDRLRSLNPYDADNYYRHRSLVPHDMLDHMRQARIVITNYHAFRLRERVSIAANTRRLLQGKGNESLSTLETEGQMLRRVMHDLMGMRNILVLNDEAHHCYREKPADTSEERKMDREDRAEADKNSEAARIWISGIEAVKRNIGARCVLDMSATPFFLRGSGYGEGTLFGWTVSDFSLMDAIESGIVKVPRVPVADNVVGADGPVFRNLYEHVRDRLPRAGRRSAGVLDPLNLPTELISALESLYGHYEKTYEVWQKQDIGLPPVFIIVCNNTATSKLIYDYVSGFERKDDDGNFWTEHLGHFDLFSNYHEDGSRRALPRTLLIDSTQLESGDALSNDFRAMAADEIERFRRERVQREGFRCDDTVSDQELLREVMNSVGKPGQLGAGIRCVVSVSMLTEGWDANTVTHILGVRAFGTQLLCEQVVGRALRRQSYELNKKGRFDAEYADVMGIPFDFTSEPVVRPPGEPRRTVRVHAVSPERDGLEIVAPRVVGYRVELPAERISADFDNDSALVLTPELVGPTRTTNQGIIGQIEELRPEHLRNTRRQRIVFELAKHVRETRLREPGESPRMHLFQQVRNIAGEWFDDHLRCIGDTYPAQLLYREMADLAAERIRRAIDAASQRLNPDSASVIKAVVDSYTPTTSTRFVNFTTSREPLWQTRPDKCHVNWVVCDSDWEEELCRIIETHPRIISYVKNAGLGFEVPYNTGSHGKRYLPDFIVRIDDGAGSDDPLNLILEVKGYRHEDVKDKSSTMRTHWVPGVNNLATYGRWAFHEFAPSVYEMQDEFHSLVLKALSQYYSTLDFKELLAAAPLEGIDLTRPRAFARDVDEHQS